MTCSNLAESSKPSFPLGFFLPTTGSTPFEWVYVPCAPCETVSPRFVTLASNTGSTARVLAKVLTFPDVATIEDTEMPQWSELENPPSRSVRTLAKTVRHILAASNVRPDRMVPSADGEISDYFFADSESHRRFATITCGEKETLVLLIADRDQGFSDAFEFTVQPESMKAALDTLTNFIESCPAL